MLNNRAKKSLRAPNQLKKKLLKKRNDEMNKIYITFYNK